MTYFDENDPRALSVRAQLREALHGGARPALLDQAALLAAADVAPPCRVVACLWPHEKAPVFRTRQKHHILRVHPGLAYLSFHGPFAPFEKTWKRRGIVYGEVQPCARIDEWIAALQAAIVSMRRRELAQLDRKHGSTLTFEAEQQALRLAVQRVRAGDAAWREAVQVWSEIVLLRHQRQLNAVRRKQVECLAMLTRDFDEGLGLDYPFRAAMDRIYGTFALSELGRAFPQLIEGLLPLLIGRRGAAAQPVSTTVARALDWMRGHYSEAVGLAETAAAAFVSPPHLARQFKRETGRTVVEYLQALRISRARELLAEGDAPIATVAEACGFPTPEHFFRTFKKRTGSTPRQYRRAAR